MGRRRKKRHADPAKRLREFKAFIARCDAENEASDAFTIPQPDSSGYTLSDVGRLEGKPVSGGLPTLGKRR